MGALVVAHGCAPGRLTLPAGAGTPFAEYKAALLGATDACRGIQTLAAELALSGRAGPSRLRGRVLAGLARPGSLRLEGLAPFGPPAFILAAQPGQSALLLPREARVLVGSDPADIVEALTGIALTPDELRLILTGCIPSQSEAVDGRAYGSTWVVIATADGGRIYLRHIDGVRRVVAVRVPAWQVEYADFGGRVPGRVRLTASRTADIGEVDMIVRLSQVRINTTLDPSVFAVDIPSDVGALTLEDLRRMGPLREPGR